MNKKQTLTEQIHKIQSLTASELDRYAQQISLSNWPSDVMKWIYRAIDIRREEVLQKVYCENYVVSASIDLD